jgi:hypothetical protein
LLSAITLFGHRTNFDPEGIWLSRQIAFRPGVISMPKASSSRFDDLDAVRPDGSPDKRVDMLRGVTDLFPGVADRLNDEQIRAFDGVLVQPVNKIEAKAPAAISTRPHHRR